ncbi:MAG: MFS transporter, partial [Proteobacteria bacterium]|nr:MFS transporter [Pseudomonadota bacterium]
MSDLLNKALRYRWLVFWILAFSYILVYFHRLCPAVVAVDMMRDLQAGGTLLGLLGPAYFYPYALMQLPAGLLSDSWGPRRSITLFFSVATIGSILLGLAPSAFWAIVGRTLVGLGVAMLFVPTMKVLAEWFRVREFATMTAILMVMGGLGSLTAAYPLALLSNWIGWRFSFVVVGVFTMVMAILVWLFVRDRPADLGWPSPAESVGSSPPSIGLLEGMRRVLTYPRFWPVAIW